MFISGIYALVFAASPLVADILDEEEPVVMPKPKQEEEPGKSEQKPVPVPVAPGKGAVKEPKTQPKSQKPQNDSGGKSGGKQEPAKKGENGKKAEPAKNEPVHFESKGLRGLREKGTVELIEEVVVTQGDLRMEADRAQIFYDENQREVVKVVATGNVKMFNVDKSTGEKMKAFCNEVHFLNSERTVVMEGNARLWRGTQSVIRGKKITYEIDSGWIKADRVAGELQPEDTKK
jgi:lipopolysaccharide transport protein LptA